MLAALRMLACVLPGGRSPPLATKQRPDVPSFHLAGNAKELRHAISTLELQQTNVEGKVKMMLEMLTQVWGEGVKILGWG